jgi:DNA primase
MARIPDLEIERLKHEVDLVALVEGSGVALRRQGKDWSAAQRAPFAEWRARR